MKQHHLVRAVIVVMTTEHDVFIRCRFANQMFTLALYAGVNTAIVLYNSMGQNRTEYIRVPVPTVVCYMSFISNSQFS